MFNWNRISSLDTGFLFKYVWVEQHLVSRNTHEVSVLGLSALILKAEEEKREIDIRKQSKPALWDSNLPSMQCVSDSFHPSLPPAGTPLHTHPSLSLPCFLSPAWHSSEFISSLFLSLLFTSCSPTSGTDCSGDVMLYRSSFPDLWGGKKSNVFVQNLPLRLQLALWALT